MRVSANSSYRNSNGIFSFFDFANSCGRYPNIVKSYKEEHESDTFDTNKISGKIKLIRCVIRWAHNTNECYNKKSYQSALKQRCENIDIEETFNNLVKWCQYRNEIIHALLNKNVSSVNKNLEARVEEGMEIARYLDAQVKHLKKDNLIRKSIGAPQN